MTLHTVNQLPDHPDCQRCIVQLAAGDAVVMLGRGVWIANINAAWHLAWERSGAALYVLEEDLAASGLAGLCAPSVTALDLPGFVALSEQHRCQRAWF
ncbi:MAG: sulfurtransferase complex subunit TusB [Chromatocurvus sp.]